MQNIAITDQQLKACLEVKVEDKRELVPVAQARFDTTRIITHGEMPTRGCQTREALIKHSLEKLSAIENEPSEEQVLITMIGLMFDMQDHANELVYPGETAGDEKKLIMLTGDQMRDFLSEMSSKQMEAELRATSLEKELHDLKGQSVQFPIHLEKVDFGKLSEPAKVGWRKAAVDAEALVGFFNWAYEQKVVAAKAAELEKSVDHQKKNLKAGNRLLADKDAEIARLKERGGFDTTGIRVALEQATKDLVAAQAEIKLLKAGAGETAQARVDTEIQRRNDRLTAELAAARETIDNMQQTKDSSALEKIQKLEAALEEERSWVAHYKSEAKSGGAAPLVKQWSLQVEAIEACRKAGLVSAADTALETLLKSIKG